MSKLIKSVVIITILLFSFNISIFSDNLSNSRYVLIESYPEYTALGGSVGAADSGISAVSLNPASAALINNVEFSFMHNMWIQGVSHEKLSVGGGFEFGVIGAEVSYMNYGSLRAIDVDSMGVPLYTGEELSLYSVIASAFFARKIQNFSLGINIKYLNENFGTYTSGYLGADIGAIYNGIIDGLNAGLSFSNISGEQDGFSLPMDLKAGVIYRIKDSNKEIVMIGLGVDFLIKDSSVKIEAGLSYSLFDYVDLRLGGNFRDSVFGFSAGFGAKIDNIGIDYTYFPSGELGDAHKMAVKGYFGKKEVEKESPEKSMFKKYKIGADFYYKDKDYSKALKYYLYITKKFPDEISVMSDKEKSSFYQRIGICYYNLKKKRNARYFLNKALKYSPENEVLKQWVNSLK